MKTWIFFKNVEHLECDNSVDLLNRVKKNIWNHKKMKFLIEGFFNKFQANPQSQADFYL